MSGTTPTQRTLKYLKAKGFDCAIAEHWNNFAGIRQDLFGWIDIVALGKDRILGVQCTSETNHNARVKKIIGLDTAVNWLEAGGEAVVISWPLARNPKPKWQDITLKDFGG